MPAGVVKELVAERRDQLLDAALVVLSAHGYGGAKVSDIVARAGVAQGTFYLYFRSKRDVVLALLDRFCGLLLSERRETGAEIGQTDEEWQARMAERLRRLLRVIDEHRSLARLFFKEALASEQAVKQAEQQLKILTAPPTDEAVAQAQAAVDAAREQANLVRRPASSQDVAVAENQVRQAEAAVQLARNPVLASDLEAARAQAEAAEAAARLAAQPYTKQDLEAAEAQVAQVQAQLELARMQLKELTVVSPVAGVVSERFLVAGSIASPSTPIVAIASPELEITFSVEESQLGRIQPGQPAKISLAALPGEALSGRVQLIAPTLDSRTRTAQVKVAPDAAALGKLRPILMTTASMVVAMAPVAARIGEGSELRAPMAVVVIGGLISSTLLTLVLIPAVYTIVDDAQGLFGRVFGFRRTGPSVPVEQLLDRALREEERELVGR